jgi:hypothetical protein
LGLWVFFLEFLEERNGAALTESTDVEAAEVLVRSLFKALS